MFLQRFLPPLTMMTWSMKSVNTTTFLMTTSPTTRSWTGNGTQTTLTNATRPIFSTAISGCTTNPPSFQLQSLRFTGILSAEHFKTFPVGNASHKTHFLLFAVRLSVRRHAPHLTHLDHLLVRSPHRSSAVGRPLRSVLNKTRNSIFNSQLTHVSLLQVRSQARSSRRKWRTPGRRARRCVFSELRYVRSSAILSLHLQHVRVPHRLRHRCDRTDAATIHVPYYTVHAFCLITLQ